MMVLLVLPAMIVNAQEKITDCSIVGESKALLNLVDGKDKPTDAREILEKLKQVSTQTLMNKCWDRKYSELVGRNIAVLLTKNDGQIETVKNIADYLSELQTDFKSLIDDSNARGASLKSKALFNSLVKHLGEINTIGIKIPLDSSILIPAAFGKQAMDRVELTSKGLMTYVQGKEAEQKKSDKIGRIEKRLTGFDTGMGEINRKIDFLSSSTNYVFIIAVAAICLTLFAFLLVLFLVMKKIKKVSDGMIKVGDFIQWGNQTREHGEHQNKIDFDGKRRPSGGDAVANVKENINLFNIQRLGGELSNLQKEVQAMKDIVGADPAIFSNIQGIVDQLKEIKSELQEMKESIQSIPEGLSKEWNTILSILKLPQTSELDENENKIKSIEEQMNALPSQITGQMVDYERQILKEIWQLRITDEERKKLFPLISGIDEQEPLLAVCSKLEKEIAFNPEYASYFADVFKPLKNYLYKLNEISATRNLIGKNEISGSPVKDLFEIKQKIYFLVFMQHLDEIPDLLNFSIHEWFSKKFLGFADHFLKYQQKEILSGTHTKEMEDVNTIILEILAYFDYEPIPIFLGKTQFNSQIHMGQSKISDSAMADGVIAEVIKSGFRKKSGDVVIQPEVIVNRL